MKEGIVKFFNDEKGYGFITDNESGKDIFVHKTGLINNVTEADKVSYEIEEGKKGLVAVNVQRV